MARALCIFTSLATGNYLYQAFSWQDWFVATDRSYFQLVAIILVIALAPAPEGR